MDKLVYSLKDYVRGSNSIIRVTQNILWLFWDKVLRLSLGLVVGIKIARYLGPAQFGTWNYVLAITTLVGTVVGLGLDSIVVRDLVRNPHHQDEILGTSFILKLAGGGLAVLVSCLIILLVESEGRLVFYLLAIQCLGFIFQSFGVIEFYFQSQIKSKFQVIAQNLAFLASAALKLFLLRVNASLVYFAWAAAIELCLNCIFLVILFRNSGQYLMNWVFCRERAVSMLKESWTFILTSLAIILYMRVDQVMLGQLAGNESVGVYSAAVRMSEIWYFVPMSIVSSVFPMIMESSRSDSLNYNKTLKYLYIFMTWSSVAVAMLTSIFSEYIVLRLYGPTFSSAAPVLRWLIWAGIAVALGAASSGHLTVENLQKYNLYRTTIGAVSNILLNIYLIPTYGALGAAVATTVSYFISVFSVIFFAETRGFSSAMLRSLIFR